LTVALVPRAEETKRIFFFRGMTPRMTTSVSGLCENTRDTKLRPKKPLGLQGERTFGVGLVGERGIHLTIRPHTHTIIVGHSNTIQYNTIQCDCCRHNMECSTSVTSQCQYSKFSLPLFPSDGGTSRREDHRTNIALYTCGASKIYNLFASSTAW